MSDEIITTCSIPNIEIKVIPTAISVAGGGVRAYCHGPKISSTSIRCTLIDGQVYWCKRNRKCPFVGANN